MIRRQKTTIFTDAKENTSVVELKRMIEGECRRVYICVCVCLYFFFALTAFMCKSMGVCIPIYSKHFDY